MILIITLIALVLWGSIATVVELRRDGFRPTPTDWNRVNGRDLSQQAESGHVYR